MLRKAVGRVSPAAKKKTFSAGMAPPSKPVKRNVRSADGTPRLVSVPDRANPQDPLRVMYYCAEGKARGLVVLAPGSRGGMGPGQEHRGPGNTIGQFKPRISCIYPNVAKELASQGYAVVHLTWRLNPTRKGAPPGTLKSPAQLLLGVADIALAARYARAQQGKRGARLPLVLIGFSFGGPSTMAAAAIAVTPDDGASAAATGATGLTPIAGVVTLGCGMRVDHRGSEAFKDIGNRLVGGASRARPHDYGGVDSESCVDAYAAAGLPLAMIHGLADVTVDPTASATIFARARGPKAALWLEGADHHARSRADVIERTLIEWIPALLTRPLPDGGARGEASAGRGVALGTGDLGPAAASEEAASDDDDGDNGDGPPVEEPAGPDASPEDDDDGDGRTGSAFTDEGADEVDGSPDSSRVGSDIDDEPSLPSTYRGGDAEHGRAPLCALPTDLGAALPIFDFVVQPDEYCPFLSGQARTL